MNLYSRPIMPLPCGADAQGAQRCAGGNFKLAVFFRP